jgi:hypothetical protein
MAGKLKIKEETHILISASKTYKNSLIICFIGSTAWKPQEALYWVHHIRGKGSSHL